MKPTAAPDRDMSGLSLVGSSFYDELVHCMRCGLCLSVCPTYSLYSLEKDSPRGRLALMRAMSEQRLPLSNGFDEAMELCLGCLACQTACPAGVPLADLLQQGRVLAETHRKKQRLPVLNLIRELLLRNVLYGPRNVELLTSALRLYQRTGLQKLNLARIFPGRLGELEKMLPRVPARPATKMLGEFTPAVKPVRGRVGLLVGCLENSLLANVCVATARVLALNGFEVLVPPAQVCCGALPAHLGNVELARQQARQNLAAFETVDFVVSDAAGCSAQLKEYGRLLEDDPQYADRARHFASKVMDITEFLAANLPLRPGMKPTNRRVAYDDPCHLVHAQRISKAPRDLLSSIPGLELVELPDSTWCCGSAGTYNITHAPEAEELLARKMHNVQKVKPDILATANTGCYIQLAAGVRKYGLPIEVVHVVELLARAYAMDTAE